jgi:predicted ATPase with chaperone activity
LAKSNISIDGGAFEDGGEYSEFGTRVLEVLRQLLEDKQVTISRAQGSLTFPPTFN